MCIAIVYHWDQMHLLLTIDQDTFSPADVALLIPARDADVEKKDHEMGCQTKNGRAAEALGSRPTGE